MAIMMTDRAKNRYIEFQKDLRSLSSVEIVRKHIIHGECCILSQQEYFDLRSNVAAEFELHPNEVLVVGSAKLGFSIAPDKPYRPFCDESDIDVVLVSSALFDEIWESVYRYKDEGGDWPQYSDFSDYFFQGWIRPDKLPSSPMFPFAKKWWEFFREVTRSRMFGYYKVAGALYKSYYFLENYQKCCVQTCMDKTCISNLEGHDAIFSEQ